MTITSTATVINGFHLLWTGKYPNLLSWICTNFQLYINPQQMLLGITNLQMCVSVFFFFITVTLIHTFHPVSVITACSRGLCCKAECEPVSRRAGAGSAPDNRSKPANGQTTEQSDHWTLDQGHLFQWEIITSSRYLYRWVKIMFQTCPLTEPVITASFAFNKRPWTRRDILTVLMLVILSLPSRNTSWTRCTHADCICGYKDAFAFSGDRGQSEETNRSGHWFSNPTCPTVWNQCVVVSLLKAPLGRLLHICSKIVGQVLESSFQAVCLKKFGTSRYDYIQPLLSLIWRI